MTTKTSKPGAAVTYTIDAAGRTLGRVASEAAHALLGKRSVHFTKHLALPMTVVVENASKMHLPSTRTKGKVYTHYTGFPGGLREQTMEEMITKKGIEEVVRKTVDGMIPRNRLRTPRMKNLVVKA
jgi:large subunit ribosomal protein L13